MTNLVTAFELGHEDAFARPFAPGAGYFSAMDCLVYLKEDVSYVAVRLSPLMTVLVHPIDPDRAVGVKVKGFRAIVIEKVRSVLKSMDKDLSEDEIAGLVSAMEAVFTASLGEKLTTEAESERRRKYESQARDLLREGGAIFLREYKAAEGAAAHSAH